MKASMKLMQVTQIKGTTTQIKKQGFQFFFHHSFTKLSFFSSVKVGSGR